MKRAPSVRFLPILPLLPLLLTSGACGGGSGEAKSPQRARAGEKDESIGDLAAAQGGLASLGGAGNREGGSGTEVAMTGPLRAEDVEKQAPVKMDGVLKEWHQRTPAKETLTGSPAGIGFAVAIQYDDGKIYLGGEITDATLTRTSAHGSGDDHVSMTLAFPAGRGQLKAYDVGLWAGKPGETAGAVKWLSGPSKGENVAGAKIVEADTKGGYTFEAVIPWSSFPEARTMRVGLRAALRYHDADNHAVVGTGAGSVDKPTELPALPTVSEQAVVDGLLGPKGLSAEAPRFDLFADVTGDERKERISVFGAFITICGPGYRDGRQFFWREMPGALASLETRDLAARGKEDVVLRRRFTSGNAEHEVLDVWSVGGEGEPQTIFTQEIAIASSDGKRRLSNALRVGGKEIEVSVEPAQGFTEANFQEPIAEGDSGILLPWGTVKSRKFRYEKGRFAKVGEVAQAGSSAPAASGVVEGALPHDVPTPPVQKGSDLSRQVLEAYYRDQGLTPDGKPRFDLQVHVDGDTRPERVLLIGRDIVVLGPSFKGGTGYARMTLSQFESDKDVAEMTARDVTGDGAADVVVRGVRHVVTPSNEKVDVEGLFIYQVRSGAIARVFAIETAREVGKKRVQGLVQFVPAKSGKGFDVDVRPGVAKGWTDKTYPWPQDPPGGALEPLLLPWGTIGNLRYTFNGTQYAASP